MKKKLIILSLEKGYGRIENDVITLANSLVGLYDIELLFLRDINENIDINSKIKVTIYNSKIIGNSKFYKELLHDKDVVISTDHLFNKYVVRNNKSKNIFWEQSFNGKIEDDQLDLIKKFDYVVVQSQKIKEYYEKFNKHVVVINSGIKIPEVESELKTNNLIFMGKLKKEKRVDLLIDVMELLHKEIDSKLYIIGEGIDRFDLENKVKDKKINYIQFLGSLNEEMIEKVFMSSSIFVTCSQGEYAGISIIKAMSYGIPVIAFNDNKLLSTLVLDDINGYLIDDDIVDMKDKIIKLLNDRESLKSFGTISKEKVLEYDINIVVREWIKII